MTRNGGLVKWMLALVCLVAMVACGGSGTFGVEGTIAGAGDTTMLVLEQSSNGAWLLVDSVATNGQGAFKVRAEAPEVPTIYRLRYGDASIYFPIDSLDHLTINSSLAAFGRDYEVAGSEHAQQVMRIDQEAMRLATSGDSASLAQWKASLSQQVAADPSGIVAYYAINKYINGRPLYDPMSDSDLRIIGAVANAYNSFHPDDPRTAYLVGVLLEGQRRRRQATPTDTIMADVASLIDVRLQDYNGKEYSLSEVAAKHRLVLLDFTIYQTEASPMLNKLLHDIYKRYSSQGLTIYQIGLDEDVVAWRQAAQNLPWITVLDPMSVNSTTVGAYNVTGMPTTFIIRQGEIVERVEDMTQLESAVKKYL